MYYEMFGQMKKMLGQMDKWLDAATEHAKAKSFDPNTLLDFRLAPNQFAFVSQVRVACDTTKTAAARLAGKEAPVHADDEKTIEELRARIRTVITYLDGYSPTDFADAATRTITQPRWEGKTMTGADYFREHAQPNFFFHTTHVYAMLRHNGVNLGKRDYLGTLTQTPPKT